jgi:rhamnulokinase
MDRAKTFLMLPNYFMYRLTGEKIQEYTNATTTGMINAKTREWDSEIIERLGFKKELFKTPAEPSRVQCEFSDEVAELVGYKALVTLPATHDTASAVVAAPIEKGSPYISSGTWSLLGVEEQTAHTDKTALAADYSNEGGVEGTVRLQKNIMGLWMIQQVRHETGDKYSFDELTKMARSSEVDLTVDVNDHRFLAPKNMTKEISDAVGRELTLGETAFVIYDSLARNYAEALEALEGITGKKYATLNIIGGGSKNSFLNELSAKYTKKKIITGPTEGTAIGNLIMQMIGSGDVESVKSAREIVRRSFEINEI